MTTENLSYEQQLFTWDGWNQGDTASFQFYDAQLKVDIGEFKAGEKFSSIDLDYFAAEITFWRDEKLPLGRKLKKDDCIQCIKVATYALVAKVGAKVEAD